MSILPKDGASLSIERGFGGGVLATLIGWVPSEWFAERSSTINNFTATRQTSASRRAYGIQRKKEIEGTTRFPCVEPHVFSSVPQSKLPSRFLGGFGPSVVALGGRPVKAIPESIES